MRPWASARCKSQPPRFVVIHCDVWPPRAFQLFVSFRDRSPVTIKPATQLLLQVHEPRRGPNAFHRRVTCLYVQLCRPVSRYSECRTALFRHRSGFTSKTLTHVHQPYVVKVSFNPRHVLRRAATRDLAIPCLSWPRRVFQRDLTHLNSPQSSAGHE